MQDETPNTTEGLSEDDLQHIAGGCANCARADQRIAIEANKTLREYRGIRALHGPQVIPDAQFQVVKSQGQAAVNRMIERHSHPIVANAIRNRYPELRNQ